MSVSCTFEALGLYLLVEFDIICDGEGEGGFYPDNMTTSCWVGSSDPDYLKGGYVPIDIKSIWGKLTDEDKRLFESKIEFYMWDYIDKQMVERDDRPYGE